jgi:hypothetical protein
MLARDEGGGAELPSSLGEHAAGAAAPLSVVSGTKSESRRPAQVDGRRVLQRRAWQWALANRRPDGSLPRGMEVARQFRRGERWGRLVKRSGLAGQLDAAA